MRLKDYAERDGKRVWLSEGELSRLIDNTAPNHREQEAAFLLAGRCGLRRQEIVDVTPTDIVTNDTGQVVRIWEGKGDKYREVPAPTDLTQLVLGMGKDPDESLVDVDPSTIYSWVARARERCHAETGEQKRRLLFAVVRRGVVEEPRQFALGEPHALAVAGVVVF